MANIIKNSIIFLINSYRKILSPMKLQTCRFYPTCSQYAAESIEKYGVAKGMLKTFVRLMKCHPLHSGGYDPVD